MQLLDWIVTRVSRKIAYYGFDKSGLSADDREIVEAYNASLDRLRARRLKTITISGPLQDSKLAWKVATFQQDILYRVVMLAGGCAFNWNANNTLSSYLAARALMETIAMLLDFERQLSRLCEESDFGGIDALITNRLFATRDDKFTSETPETKAVNAQTFIDKFDQNLLPGTRRHYDFLSERCHPNSLGHHFFFSTLDTNTGTSTYSDEKNRQVNFDHILGGAMLIGLAENSIIRLDAAILKISELHSAVHPVARPLR